MIINLRRAGLGLLAVALLGCGGGRSDLARVRGRVTLSDKPLPGVTVVFAKDGAERWSFGETNDQGEFTLTTFEPGDGAFLGVNKVTISQPKPPATGEAPSVSPGPTKAPIEAEEPLVPRSYNDLSTTELTVDVQPGSSSAVELKLKPAPGS